MKKSKNFTINEFALEEAKVKILKVLEEAFENQIITKDDFSSMNPNDKEAAKFYCNFKVHKQVEHNVIPPV